MSISDLVRTEARMTALHFKTIEHMGLRYGLVEAMTYDLCASFSWSHRYDLRRRAGTTERNRVRENYELAE